MQAQPTMLFTKMHGLGNDFVVIDCTQHTIALTKERIQQMAHRHTGIGFDQLLIVQQAPSHAVDFGYQIFNADGSDAERLQ